MAGITPTGKYGGQTQAQRNQQGNAPAQSLELLGIASEAAFLAVEDIY